MPAQCLLHYSGWKWEKEVPAQPLILKVPVAVTNLSIDSYDAGFRKSKKIQNNPYQPGKSFNYHGAYKTKHKPQNNTAG